MGHAMNISIERFFCRESFRILCSIQHFDFVPHIMRHESEILRPLILFIVQIDIETYASVKK